VVWCKRSRKEAADGSNGAAHRQWAQDLWKSLAPFALPGGYANLLGRNDREQMAAAYRNTRPGSVPSSVASIPIGSSHLRFRCRRGRPVLSRLKRIPRELQSCRSLPVQRSRLPLLQENQETTHGFQFQVV
jgi:hypothetical protein